MYASPLLGCTVSVAIRGRTQAAGHRTVVDHRLQITAARAQQVQLQLFVKARVMRAVTLILTGAAAFAPRNALPVTARRSPTRQTARMVIG